MCTVSDAVSRSPEDVAQRLTSFDGLAMSEKAGTVKVGIGERTSGMDILTCGAASPGIYAVRSNCLCGVLVLEQPIGMNQSRSSNVVDSVGTARREVLTVRMSPWFRRIFFQQKLVH